MPDDILAFPIDNVTLGEKPSVDIVTITPTLAADILSNLNPQNRKINPINLRKLKSEMRNGEWKFNGDTISFTSDGMLFDGQHRLQAIVETSLQQTMVCVYNIDFETAFGTKDSGKTRSEADYLVIACGASRKDAPTIAKACHMLARWESTRGRAVIVGAANKMPMRKVGEYYDTNSAAIDYALNWLVGIKNKDLLLDRAEALFVASLILSADADAGEVFLDQVFKGIGLEEKTTTKTVNEQLHDWRNHFQRTKEKKYTSAQRILSVLSAWVLYREGKNRVTRNAVLWRDGKDYPAVPFGQYTI